MCEGDTAYCRTSEEVKSEKNIFKATAREWATLFHWAPHWVTSTSSTKTVTQEEEETFKTK